MQKPFPLTNAVFLKKIFLYMFMCSIFVIFLPSKILNSFKNALHYIELLEHNI